MSLQNKMSSRYITGMENSSGKSPRKAHSSGGWNAINLVPSSLRSITPCPNSGPLDIRSSESPFEHDPPSTTPIFTSSDGIKRAEMWLRSREKRREAALATVMASGRSAEPSSAEHVPSSRTLQPSPSQSSHSTRTIPESRVVPPLNTSKRKLDLISRAIHTPRCTVQVVIPACRRRSLLSPSPAKIVPQATLEPLQTISSASTSTVDSVPSSEKVEIQDSRASSEEDVSPNHLFPDEGEVYEVERILDERTRRGVQEFLIKWRNYEQVDWVAKEACFCEDLIQSFKAVPRPRKLELLQANPQNAPDSSRDRQRRAQRRAEKVATVQKKESFMRRVNNAVRDPNTSKFRRDMAISTTDSNGAPEDDREMADTAAEISPSKKAHCNTARFSTRPAPPTKGPAPAVVHTRWDEAIGKIVFQRKRAEVDPTAASLEGDRDASSMEHDVNRRERQASTAKGKRKASGSRSQTRHPRRKHKLRGGEPLEIPGCSSMESPQLTGVASSPRVTFSGAPKQQKRGPVHIRFDDNALLDKLPSIHSLSEPAKYPPVTEPTTPSPLNRASGSRISMSCDEILRKARSAEKMAVAPSVLRHEFSDSMSTKHAVALINQSRRSPERAFGFSLPSNAILLSIENDD